MKKFLIAAALTAFAGGAHAQAVQTDVVGASGNAAYPVVVTASNGVTYYCEETTERLNGVLVRRCIRAGGGGLDPFGAGAGPIAIGAGVLALGALIAAADSTDGT